MHDLSNLNIEEEAARLRGSLLEFIKFFYQYITKREFIVSRPIGRESHHIIICRALTMITRLEADIINEAINLPPGHGKSTIVALWIAWCYTHYADCNFLYISYAQELAAKHTAFIKTVMTSKAYRMLFGVELKKDSKAKDNFSTTAGGTVAAFGSGGAITGNDAGLPGLDRFSGAVVMDDLIKPDDGHSDTIRNNVINNYKETISQRPRGINVPIISIGQRIHEEDVFSFLLSGKDIYKWDSIVLKSIDDAGNALYPEVFPLEKLRLIQEHSPYVFASQHQQDPNPAGDSLYSKEWFYDLDEEPEFLLTFITADTAETDKQYNDATVLHFFGVYEIENFGAKSGKLGLHSIDCLEVRVQPKDLQDITIDFIQGCMLHKTPPTVAIIEEKSTGTTLVSVLKERLRGIVVRGIKRTMAHGSKSSRFIAVQSYLSQKIMSFYKYARHKETVINHMIKITANDTHRHDDIADTVADAIDAIYISKTIHVELMNNDKAGQEMANNLLSKVRLNSRLGAVRNGRVS